jgi:hypothetical protein
MVAGEVFHVHSVVSECEVKFSVVHQGGTLPVPTLQTDDVITMRTVDRDSRDAKELTAINRALAPSLGLVRGVTHAQFLRSFANDSYYFLEIGACVGGAFAGGSQFDTQFLDRLVEVSTGVNLWREWAKLEAADLRDASYPPPDSFEGYAGSVVCHGQSALPDQDMNQPAVVSRFRKDDCAGLILRAATPERVQNLVEELLDAMPGHVRKDGPERSPA